METIEIITRLRKEGGSHLRAARSWIQSNCVNGSTVTWGSGQVLRPHLTVAQVEDLSVCVATAVIMEFQAVHKEEMKRIGGEST